MSSVTSVKNSPSVLASAVNKHNIQVIAERKQGEWFIVQDDRLVRMGLVKKVLCYLFFFYRMKINHDVRKVVHEILAAPEDLIREIARKTRGSTYRFLLAFQDVKLSTQVTKAASRAFVADLKQAHLNLVLKNIQPVAEGASGSYRIYSPELFSDESNLTIQKATNLFIFKPKDESPFSPTFPGFAVEAKRILYSTILSPLAGDSLVMNGNESFAAESFAYKLGSFVKDVAKQYLRSGRASSDEKYWLEKFDPFAETHVVDLPLHNRLCQGSLSRWINGNIKMGHEYFGISRHAYFASLSERKTLPNLHYGTLKIFDRWINNGDRHLANILCESNESNGLQNLYYIDHGYSMPPNTPSASAYFQIKNFAVMDRLAQAKGLLTDWDRFLIEAGYKNRNRLYKMALEHYNSLLPNSLEVNKKRADTFRRSLEYLYTLSKNPHTTYEQLMDFSQAKAQESA